MRGVAAPGSGSRRIPDLPTDSRRQQRREWPGLAIRDGYPLRAKSNLVLRYNRLWPLLGAPTQSYATLWRVHKWHHSPTYMYWLGGVRATLPQQFLVNIPYVMAYLLLDISPWWIMTALGIISTVQNDWMHMNVTWRSNWLEWIFVTPRYHHIHHSVDPRDYMANMR